MVPASPDHDSPQSPVCCVDVGGTTIKTGTLCDGGDLTDRYAVPSALAGSSDAHEVIEAVLEVIGTARRDHGVLAAGVVVPGIVDEARGDAIWSANLRWRDVPFRRRLEEGSRLPVAFGHDVRAGALAESRLGAARGSSGSLFLAIGTGIAAGSVIGGRAVCGGGWAGEIGHADVGHSEVCACGLTGCLEAIASAAAIARRYSVRTSGGAATAAAVAERVRGGDAVALRVWSDAVKALGFEIAQVAKLVAPEIVVIGGGLGRAGELLLAPLREEVTRRLGAQPAPRIVPAQLGDQAGCVGAGLLALDLLAQR